MDPRFFEYYNTELFHLKESAAEFAKEFPKIASRLTLDGMECADPYVERLLEGFAFLTARIQLKMDAAFPEFIQNLTEVIYPNYLSPTPSMAIVKLEPDTRDGAVINGVTISRDTALRARMGADAQTACEFRTAQDVTLWPISITNASFEAHSPTLPRNLVTNAAGTIRIHLESANNISFDKLPIQELVFYISAEDRVASLLQEHILAYTDNVLILPHEKNAQNSVLGPGAIRAAGLGDSQSLLPISKLAFRGYRLLQEYAAFPSRYLFFRLRGLKEALSKCKGNHIEVVMTLSKASPELERLVDLNSFQLFATPVINLFPKTADRIFLDFKSHEFHIIPDRARPMDYEVHSIRRVTGFGGDTSSEVEVRPLYASIDKQDRGRPQGNIFYALKREKRQLSANQKLKGNRTAYIGTETFVTIVDTQAPPFPDSLKQLSIETLCTNRDLAIMIPLGHPNGDFSLDVSVPVNKISCIKGPSRPIPPALEGDSAWRLISQLSVNYLSLTDSSPEDGAKALREILALYCLDEESTLFNQIQGVRSIKVNPIVRRMPEATTVTFARGHEIIITIEPRFFEGQSPIVLASVLEQFFARHASINSFTETVLRIQGRGEIKRWPARLGRRPLL